MFRNVRTDFLGKYLIWKDLYRYREGEKVTDSKIK